MDQWVETVLRRPSRVRFGGRVTSRIGEIVLDAPDPAALARFWCDVLGWVVVHEEEDWLELFPQPMDDQERLADIRQGAVVPSLLVVRTTDEKTAKTRVHLDVTPVDCSHDEEVARLLALGACRVDVGQTGEESWTVLADPAGNEFCVARSLAPGHFSL